MPDRLIRGRRDWRQIIAVGKCTGGANGKAFERVSGGRSDKMYQLLDVEYEQQERLKNDLGFVPG